MCRMTILLWLWIAACLTLGPFVAFTIWVQPVFDEMDKLGANDGPNLPLFIGWCGFIVAQLGIAAYLL